MFHLKVFPTVRSIYPRFCKAYIPCNGIQRNYWRRRDAFSELSSAMQSMESYMRDMDKEMSRIFGNIQQASPVKFPRLLSPFDCGRARDIPVVPTGDGKSYKLNLDVQGMEPEDISITLKNNNELTVTARREEKREDGSRFVRESTYHYTLPKEINLDTIRSSLTDGVLTIEAALPALESKEIPVKVENEQNSNSDSDTNK